jgi:predicted nuclease with RNAse H fold
MATACGLDVGAKRVNGVVIDSSNSVVEARLLPTGRLEYVTDWAAEHDAIAIDSPDALSTGPHSDDSGLAPKFRTGRCAEIGLARNHHIYVPWVTPMTVDALASWMKVGMAIFARLRADGHAPIEVYPHAAFRVLAAGGKLHSKQTAQGLTQRIALMKSRGCGGAWIEMWSHDGLDALVAALVAADNLAGKAEPASCGHDGSAIWLPATAKAVQP